ncbi:MAG: glycoside hydrolase clan [Microbacteriaceae bacterium]|nr:glycoside hydrolase clan [Microbacteriaceae bacterium]
MQWTLHTRATDYVVSLLPDGSGVVLDYWGERTDVEREAWSEPARITGWATPSDSAPLEYASNGQRHTAFSELLVDRGDSRTGASWRVDEAGIAFETGQRGDSLDVPFIDETGTLRLTLHATTSADHDVVRRWITLENSGESAVELPRAFSAGWNVPVGQRVRVDYLAGSWSREFQRRRVDLDWGTFSIGSRQGMTGLAFSPVVTLTALPDIDSFVRPASHAYGVALEWSGSWRLQVDSNQVGQSTRVSCGVDDDTTTITLLAGESFVSPQSAGVFSADGVDGVSQAWHRYQQLALARDLTPWHRPVVYNSWMATTFDVRIDHQLELAGIAADLGVEVFVVDDGWFVGRTSDRAGLGDWTPDPAKFPGGLSALADRVIEKGMRFGLWVEPECVNPDSDLFRQHPDWVYRAEGRPLLSIRNQYVLDLGRQDVVEWVEDVLRTLLTSTPISYIKWDMNRPVTDGGRAGDPHGREWSVQHTRSYYRILRMLRAEFPDVTLEACASGGGRIDNAVLALSDVVWTSDEVGARDRLVIQDGFLSAYPAHVMSSWVSDDLGHRDRSPSSLGYRFAVAMAGVLGIGSDLLAWDAEERDEAGRHVARYKELRNVVHRGTSVTHGRPTDNLYCVEYRGPADDERIVLFVYDRDRDRTRDREQPRVFPTTLDADRRYRVAGSEQVVSGASARGSGVLVPFGFASDADVLVLDPLD